MLWIKFDFAEINVYSLKQNAVSYFLLKVMVEDNIKGTMFVFIFVGGIGLENWSNNSLMIKILQNNEDSHSFTVFFPPIKVGMDK